MSADNRNPHAVALGRLGGLRGGPATRDSLTPAERLASAKRANAASWTPSARAKRLANGRKRRKPSKTSVAPHQK